MSTVYQQTLIYETIKGYRGQRGDIGDKGERGEEGPKGYKGFVLIINISIFRLR